MCLKVDSGMCHCHLEPVCKNHSVVAIIDHNYTCTGGICKTFKVDEFYDMSMQRIQCHRM